MSERLVTVGRGVELCLEEFGRAADPVLVLIMGIGTQLIGWEEAFCRQLADGGSLRVVRFDNRDVGHSTWFTQAGRPDLGAVAGGEDSGLAYTLSDMAGDVVGLLDALGADRAHVAGASMGGMIAQLVAIAHPDRIASLISIMSRTGAPGEGESTPEAVEVLLRPAPAGRQAYIDAGLPSALVIGSPGLIDEQPMRRRRATAFDRGLNPEGFMRQMAAIFADGDRTERLAGVRAPTLVLHGEADVLIDPSGGRATAAAIPGARFALIPGMGHDLPEARWPAIVAAILDHIADAP
ncbi:MAG TPA: alpha/beta fold hydrolase [Solirubrobacteraceae bacterium]|nr:alpha/beta fold hydrolase [Solirubrobacteraceae bacterium]